MKSMHSRIILVFCLLDFLHFASAAVLIVVSAIWITLAESTSLNSDTLRRLVVHRSILNGGIVMGSLIFTTFLISIYGLLSSMRQGRALVRPLIVFNVSLLILLLATISVGGAIWFFTLRERVAYAAVWQAQSPAMQQFLQDTLKCCGYFDATPAGLFSVAAGFCSNPSQITPPTDPNLTIGCVTPITNFADYVLNNIFTSIYGFAAIQVCLFLCTCCLINSREEQERFSRIDSKGGGKGGFV